MIAIELSLHFRLPRLTPILRKSFTARERQREHQRFGRVLQDESFDRSVRDNEEFAQKLDYIVGNPWKRWPELGDYPWVWPLDR